MTDNVPHFDAQTHPDDDLLNDYVSGDGTPEVRAAIAAHLATCDACREDVRSLRGTAALLRGLPQIAPPVSFQLGPEYAKRSGAGGGIPAAPSKVVRLLPLVRTLSVAAVLLFLVVGGATFIEHRGQGGGEQSAMVAPTSETNAGGRAFEEAGNQSSDSEAPPRSEALPSRAGVVDQGDSASADINNPAPASSGQDAESTPQDNPVGQGAAISSERVDNSGSDGFPWLSTTIGLGVLAVVLVGLWIALTRLSRGRRA